MKIDEHIKNLGERLKTIKMVSPREVLSGDVLNRQFLRRQTPFIIFVVVLSLLLVYNGFAHERELRQVKKLQDELVDVKNTSLSVSKELLQMSRQSYVEKKLKDNGSTLRISKQPPMVVE